MALSTWTIEIRYEGYGEMKGNRSYIPLYLHFLYTFYWLHLSTCLLPAGDMFHLREKKEIPTWKKSGGKCFFWALGKKVNHGINIKTPDQWPGVVQ